MKDAIAKVQRYGIDVWGDFLFGFDEHTPEIFQQTLDFIKKININMAFPHLMIPFPGSKTFEKLDSERRILTKDWSKYDRSHAVYQPAGMTPSELEEGTGKERVGFGTSMKTAQAKSIWLPLPFF